MTPLEARVNEGPSQHIFGVDDLLVGIIGGSLISGATSLLGSKAQSKAAKQSAAAQQEAARIAAESQERMFETGRKDMYPWRDVGGRSLYTLADLMGIETSPRYAVPPDVEKQIAELESQKAGLGRTGGLSAAIRNAGIFGQQPAKQSPFGRSLIGNVSEALRQRQGLYGGIHRREDSRAPCPVYRRTLQVFALRGADTQIHAG